MIEKAVEFLKNIEGEVNVYHHNDCDGICSAAIFLAYLKERGIKPKLNCVDINEESFKILKKEKTETAIFLDLPVDEFIERIEGFEAERILVVDHHKITEDLNKKGIAHINPRFEEPDAYISASQISYQICKVKSLEWLARIGAVGDRALEGAEDEREAADMIDAIACLKKNKELASLAKLLSGCKKIEDFLYIEKYRKLKEAYENEIKKQISLFEIYGVSDINWFEVKSGFPVTSSLATRLFDIFPKKTIITYTKSKGVYNLSGRSKKYDLGSIFKKASEGLGTGGGHPQAAGAEVKNFHEFKRRVIKMME